MPLSTCLLRADPRVDRLLADAVVFGGLRDGDAVVLDPANDLLAHFRRDAIPFHI